MLPAGAIRGEEGHEGRKDFYFQNQATLKVYENLLVNPGELTKLQGAVGSDRNPVENCVFLFVLRVV